MKGKKIIKNKIKKIKKRIYLLERQPVNQTGSRVEPSQVPRIVKEGGVRKKTEKRGERREEGKRRRERRRSVFCCLVASSIKHCLSIRQEPQRHGDDAHTLAGDRRNSI